MINYHHLGGRSGTYPLLLKDTIFCKDVNLTLYEADRECIEQIKAKENNAFGKVNVIPYCVSSKRGIGDLYINYHPTTNSIYKFNENFKDYCGLFDHIFGEYRLGDACKKVKTESIEFYSFRDILENECTCPVDFLSLDIQGAEYDVLHGARDIIKEHCLGIVLEVSFAEIYKKQKKFFSIHNLLESMNFELIEVGQFSRFSPISLPTGFRSEEQQLQAEAIYIKKISELNKKDDPSILYKSAFFALLNKNIGICLKVLSIIHEKNYAKEQSTNSYEAVLDEIWQFYLGARNISLPKISELLPKEMLSQFYKGQSNDSAEFNHINQKIQKTLQKKILPHLDRIKELNAPNHTELEILLKKCGLTDLAMSVKKHRLHEASWLLKLLNNLNDRDYSWRKLWNDSIGIMEYP